MELLQDLAQGSCSCRQLVTAGKVGSDLHNVIDFLKIYFSSIVCSEMTQSGQPQDGMSSSGPQIALQQRGRTGMEWVCCSQL